MKYLLILVIFLLSCEKDECTFTFKVTSEIYKKSTRGEVIFRNGFTQVLQEKYYEHGGQKVELKDSIAEIKLYIGTKIMYSDSYKVHCNDLIELE